MTIVAAVCIALAVFIASRSLLGRRGAMTAQRLASISAHAGDEAALGVGDRVFRPIASGLFSRSSALLPASLAQRIDARLVSAGQPVSSGTFLAILVGAPVTLGGLSALAFAGTPGAGFVPVFAAFGILGPIVWLSGRVTRRQLQINRELPDALDLIVVSVEAGLGLEGAIARITEHADGPLSDELRRVLAEMNLGLGRRRALQGLAARTGVTAVASLVSAILQAEQTGMGIAQVLRAQSDHLRTLRRQRAEEAAMKAPLKMLFPLVFFIFPSLFVVVLGPAVLQLLRAMSTTR